MLIPDFCDFKLTVMGLKRFMLFAESGILCAHQPVATLKGENVTLSDGTEQPAGDVVYWFLDEELLAVKWYNTVEYHVNKTDKLHLDPQTGSLTIKEVSACDCGGYVRMDYTFIHQGDHQLNITSELGTIQYCPSSPQHFQNVCPTDHRKISIVFKKWVFLEVKSTFYSLLWI